MSLGYNSDLNFLLVFIALSIGFIYCCIFLALCIYHFCISTTLITKEISVLQLLISCYCGFWTLKYLFSSIYVSLLYFDIDDHHQQDIINFTQRFCSGISTKLLYVIIVIRVYYTFKDTIYRLPINLFITYFIFLFIAWVIDLIADIYVVLVKLHVANVLYMIQSFMELTLGIVFIYQFNHRLFQLILSQSSYDYHYGSTRTKRKKHHKDKSNKSRSLPSLSPIRPKPPITNGTNGTNNEIADHEHECPKPTKLEHNKRSAESIDSLLLNAKQTSLLDIITKNTILASTAIVSYDIFVIAYTVLELHPYDITNIMVPLYYLQILATFIEMLCVYFTFNWSERLYGICCDSCHGCCIKCCRYIVKRKIKSHSRHDSLKSTELI